MAFNIKDRGLQANLERNVAKNQADNADSMEKLASGTIFTRSDPQPAERALAEGLEFKLRSLASSKRNINSAVSLLQAAESSQRGFLFTDNEIYLAPFDATKAAAQRQLERLRVLMAPEPQTQPMLDRLSAIVADKVTEDRKSTRLNSSHTDISRMPSSA